MSRLLAANNAQSTLAAGINDVVTELSVQVGDGALFSAPGAGEAFRATVYTLDAQNKMDAREIVECTARVADALTIVRAQEGTAAQAWGADTRIMQAPTAGVHDNIWAGIDAAKLAYFTEAAAATPQVVNSLTATGADANIGAAVCPKGTGALTAQIPDGAEAGGNARGTYAVDWQMLRASATKVANGVRAVVGGGYSNTASGGHSIVAGGAANTASGGQTTVGGGYNNTASGSSSIVGGGEANTAGGLYSIVGGGYNNTASEAYSAVSGGWGAVACLHGQNAGAAGRFGALGDAQRSDLVARRQTTNATVTGLFLDGTSYPAELPAGKVWRFTINLIAKQTAGAAGTVGDSFAVTVVGAIKRIVNATSLVGAVVYRDEMKDAAAAWAVTVDADDVNEALRIQVTGEANKTIRWVAHIQLVEVL